MESPFPSRAELDPPEQTPHVCLLACSPHPDGSTDAAARLLEQALLSRGATVDRIRLREYAIHPCIGCGYCSAHPGHCVFDGDDVADLFRRMEHADSLILNIPVYFYDPRRCSRASSTGHRFFGNSAGKERARRAVPPMPSFARRVRGATGSLRPTS